MNGLVAIVLALWMTTSSVWIYEVSNLQDDVKKYRSESSEYKQDSQRKSIVIQDLQQEMTELKRQQAALEEARDLAVTRERAALIARDKARASRSRRVPGVATGALHKITMYCINGRTASGKATSSGMVATRDRNIPFGTKIVIDGLGTFTVEDRIGYGSEYDIWTPSCSTAISFGRKFRRVTILGS